MLKRYAIDLIKKFLIFFSWEAGKTIREPGYSFWAASIDASASKSALTWVVIMVRLLSGNLIILSS
jgi:hypothetical protein